MNHDEQEWLAQQIAMAREHLAPRSVETDARARSYERVARALRIPPAQSLPADFAVRTAARAAAGEFTRFESVLMIALVVALGICAAAIVPRFAEQWLWMIQVNGWVLALAACIAVAWAIDPASRRALERARR
jgi:hypothetical protein